MTQITRGTALLLTSFLCGSSLIAVRRPANQEKNKESDSCEKYSADVAPRFKVVRETRKMTKSSLVLFVSVAPSDTTRNRLVALSCELGRKYAAEENVFVWILDSKRAAKRFNPLGAGTSGQTYLSYRGLYGFSREPGSAYGQSLSWKPDRNDPNHWVEIDLGPPPKRPGT